MVQWFNFQNAWAYSTYIRGSANPQQAHSGFHPALPPSPSIRYNSPVEFARAQSSQAVKEILCDDAGHLLVGVVSSTSSAAAASTYNVADAITSQILANTNSSRKGLILENDSIYDCYVKFGVTASLTSYTVKMTPYGYYEMPEPIYTGNVDGIWTGDSSGAMRVTELT